MWSFRSWTISVGPAEKYWLQDLCPAYWILKRFDSIRRRTGWVQNGFIRLWICYKFSNTNYHFKSTAAVNVQTFWEKKVTQFCTNNFYILSGNSWTLFMIDYSNTKITVILKESYRFCLSHLNYILYWMSVSIVNLTPTTIDIP
jgi:hypothetical protein